MYKKVAVVAMSSLLLIGTAVPAQAHNTGPRRSRAPGTVNGYPCGGALPPCFVLHRESRGNPTAQNRRSSASGLWQFIDSTWNRHGGYRKARHAPVAVQNEKARLLWANGKGCRHWGRIACR